MLNNVNLLSRGSWGMGEILLNLLKRGSEGSPKSSEVFVPDRTGIEAAAAGDVGEVGDAISF